MNKKPFRLAVRAVIREEAGRCLLLRRSPVNQGFAGYWQWPGGKADPGEEFENALRREVREETGLEIELDSLAGAFGFETAQARIVTLCLEARQTGGTLRLSEEHDASEWVPLEELANRRLREVLKPVLKTLLERKELP